jgi:hypothetical protein
MTLDATFHPTNQHVSLSSWQGGEDSRSAVEKMKRHETQMTCRISGESYVFTVCGKRITNLIH